MGKSYLHVLCPPVWEKLPPLGVAYLLSFIENIVSNFKFYDLNALLFHAAPTEIKKTWTINPKNKNEEFFSYFFSNFHQYFENILESIEELKPEYIGFSIFNINKTFTKKTIEFIRQYFPSLKIILGGPETFSLNAMGFKEKLDGDYIVVGEGEKPLYEILSGVSDKRLYLFEELKTINFFPTFKSFNLDLYKRRNSLPLMFGRGCINRCNFCSERLLYKNYKVFSEEIVIEAIRYYIENFNVRWFTFYDSMLNANLMTFERLLDKIIENRFNIVWDAQISIRNEMDERIFYKMKEAGCINLFIGLETGSDSLLKKMGKSFSLQDAIKFFDKLNKANLHYELSFIIGYPDETEDEFEETLTFLKNNFKLILKIAQVSVFKNYPGICARKISIEEEKSALKKLDKFVDFLEKYNIKYTKSYINNLI